MAKKDKEAFDYSKLSLPEVIKRKTNRKVSFFELELDEQRGVLDYIRQRSINIRIFEKKWFDILTKKFYVIELKPKENELFGITKEKSEFETFEELYRYVHGDVYEHSCFFGYTFSKSEIETYGLNVKNLNFDAFTDSNIDLYTFETINAIKEEDSSAKANRAKEIIKWIDRCKPITTVKELESTYKQFVRKFDFWDAKRVFFSMIVRKYKDSIKDSVIDFACHHDRYEGFGFDNVLLTYGRDAALYVIENYGGMWSYNTTRKHIREFKDALLGYDSKTFQLNRRCGFDDDLQLYFVRDRFYNNVNCALNREEYFGTFEEFISFVEGNLCGADLSKAPLERKDIKGYKVDDNTFFPISKKYNSYELIKKFYNGKFIVKQKWLDNEGIIVLSQEHRFDYFFDFARFLNKDISDADLLLCDGVENLKEVNGLCFEGIKVRSEVAEKLGLPLKIIPEGSFKTKEFETSDKFEIATVDNLLAEHLEDDDYSGKVSYVTDIHLLHRFNAYKCKTEEDVNYVIRVIAKTLSEQATGVNLIGGDTSSDFDIFKVFVSTLSSYARIGNFFFTLGNHELWGLNNEDLYSIIDKYKAALEENGNGRMHLVQNNLFFHADREWKEITETELFSMSFEELRSKTRAAKIIIFGGIGFAGMNGEFNADSGIYMNVLDKAGELRETTKFLNLYEKVTTALRGKNLIILTHMPMKDWGGQEIHAKEGFVYVNGHSHRNYFYDDGKKRIYADNQVGYRGKRISFKQVAVDFNFDWFADYKDGIYEITKKDYENFYRGIGESLTFNRQYEKLFMIKREETYMFLMKTIKGSMLILNGGSIRRAGNHTLEYFYENMVKYSKSVSLFLSKYDSFQKLVSSEVKKIGGYGTIHGSIVDIDFYNHLYLNPLDGSITSYFAYSMVDKYVYENFPSLLKYECPKLYEKYIKLLGEQNNNSNALIVMGNDLPISKKKIYVDSTEMYKISRILKGLQFTTKYNIVRIWNDAVVANASEENGKLIVSGIIKPDSIPQVIKESKPKEICKSKSKKVKSLLSKDEKIKIRDDKYKEKILLQTNGNISCLVYRGSINKADYKCNKCGYEWSTRPDHLKDRQNYRCPKCGGVNRK